MIDAVKDDVGVKGLNDEIKENEKDIIILDIYNVESIQDIISIDLNASFVGICRQQHLYI